MPNTQRKMTRMVIVLHLLVRTTIAVRETANTSSVMRGHVAAISAHALAVKRRHHQASRLLVRRVLLEDDGVIAEEKAHSFGEAGESA